MSNLLVGDSEKEYPPEPRWPAVIAALAIGGLAAALPEELAVGPRWMMPVIIMLLMIPAIIAHRQGNHAMNHMLGIALNSILTVALTASVILLVLNLQTAKESPIALLRSAGALWTTNVLVFAVWYWRLDAGGPHRRDAVPGHSDGGFLFPQMTMSNEDKVSSGLEDWSPQFMDYLFLAFNTSTALSPTDVAPLSRWAKALMMLQSSMSLTIIAVLASRAVNTL